ncbi:hypothetical protein GUJ93_ZPchr0012g21886 [Zizania palustris]|uniref:Ribosomal RNA-processing protein 8 n=1 Tax=Zizania palustris TaxID=103762 RepID=A0A8J5WQ99_ZIZPA|nr:hypothetical protein GUJ93_ZPchr0012g21886 [Zizania palustris]
MHATTTVRVEDMWQPNSLHLPPSRFESGSSFPCFAPAILGVHALLYKNTQPHRFGVTLASVFCTSSIYNFTSIDHDLGIILVIATWTVADFGCGNAATTKNVKNKVLSIDLGSEDPSVIACDMAHVRIYPLLASFLVSFFMLLPVYSCSFVSF